MKKAITLIKEIDKLAEQLIENYSIEEVNKAYEDYLKRHNPSQNYIVREIYLPQDD